jgi:hypothetical protein
VKYHSDGDATVRTVQMYGRPSIVLPFSSQPAWRPGETYHVSLQGVGMASSTSFSSEQHVRIFPSPFLYQAEIIGGTSISLQWTGVAATGVQYNVIYHAGNPATEPDEIVDTGTQRIWQLSGLAENTTYVVRVCARDQWGNRSQPSATRLLHTGTGTPSDVESLRPALKLRAWPVPARGTDGTNLTLALPQSGAVDLTIFSVTGQVVRKLVRETRNAGTYVTKWDGRDDGGRAVAGGLYVVRLRTSERSLTQKLVLVR